ncbi:hypothetical protein CVT26_000256 [Gymnopilus dilepis]|uniref:WLM domain-containing protein n=1 Tax=Gymnopilus dilepis TaxID=231916 RepID=A0A409VGE0_9AGAR|nr:hypothetical protein CVT26_000256 [Gymnopilus dilepis]
MRRRSQPRNPPSSSHAPSSHNAHDLNLNELVDRIGRIDPEIQALSPSQPSYISLLPPEILTEIFTYCVPLEQYPIPCRTEAPLLLLQVSSQWRNLALSIPDLWAALHINYKDAAEDIPAAETWLARSRHKLLTLSIAIDFGEQRQQEILDVLCRHSKRWKHVRFDFRHLLCPPMYSLDLAQDNVPELTTFEFHSRDISTTNISPVTRLLSSAPKLREVAWVDDVADTETLLELPLGRLSRLSLAMEHGTLDYLQLLNQCHNLEHIRIMKPSLRTPQSRPPLFLSKLTTLNISSDLIGILDHLILPALREVRIYSDADKQTYLHPHFSSSHLPHGYPHHSAPATPSPEVWSPSPFLSLIDRSTCTITSLSVTPPMTEDMLLMCLRQLSDSLVKLSVEGIVVGDLLLESLTRRSCMDTARGQGHQIASEEDQEDHLCPNLAEINLDTRVVSSQGVLAAMVQSRLAHPRHQLRQEEPDLPRTLLGKLRIVDGHQDLEMLQELSQRNSWLSAHLPSEKDRLIALMVHLRLNEKEANPNPHINFITPLPSDPEDQEEARKLLRALAAQVRPVMKAHGFAVNSLEEYEYNRVFAGRNWNNGETVELVLRRADGTFYPNYWLMSTLCHELAHIAHMNHGPAFQALWARLRAEVRRLQDRGYYGDGYWSSGRRLRDSARIGEEGLETEDLPEYMCGGAQSRARPTARRRRQGARGKRREVVPSLHTGAQTAKKRKAGGRVTSKYAFTGEGQSLASSSTEGTGFGKRANSKKAREERALAIERRLAALQGGPQAPAETPEGDEEESDDEVEFVSETDAERRQALQEAEQGQESNQKLGPGFSWSQFKDEFNFDNGSSASGSKQPQVVGDILEIFSDEDEANACDVPVASGSTYTTTPSTASSVKGKGKASLNKQDGKSLGLGKLVQSEIDFRKKEALGMALVKGGGRKLGSKPDDAQNSKVKTSSSPGGVWSCLVCTLENQPSDLACAACETLRNERVWRQPT